MKVHVHRAGETLRFFLEALDHMTYNLINYYIGIFAEILILLYNFAVSFMHVHVFVFIKLK